MTDLDLDAIEARAARVKQALQRGPVSGPMSLARTDVPALVAALREARADRDTAVLAAVRAEADRDEARAEVEEQSARKEEAYRNALAWRARYEALRDGVLAWCDEPDWSDDPAVSPIALDRLRAVVARVEES